MQSNDEPAGGSARNTWKSRYFSILRHIHYSQPVTRQALCEQLALSSNHLSILVSELIAQGLVTEDASQDGAPGRPPALLSINASEGRVVGLDIGGTKCHAVLGDWSGNVIAAVTQPTQAVTGRDEILENIVHLVEAVCWEGGTSLAAVSALGIGLGGIVDTRNGTVLGWPNTPAWAAAWTGLDVAGEFKQRLGVDLVVVEDNVRAMGVTAHRFGPAKGYNNFLYVFLGDGIGSGLFLDGRPYRGGVGVVGELGHITIQEDGPWCSCGNRGCLEVMASTATIISRVKERLAEAHLVSSLRDAFESDSLTLAGIIEAARKGDKVAFQILDETGMFVGKVIAIALNLLSPELVLFGGPLVAGGSIVLDAIQHQVRLHALQHISAQTSILYDPPDETVGARGAAILAADAFFDSPAHLQKLVERGVV